MPIPTRATLKSYFETGDQPTQAQFAAVIDAIYDLSQETIDVADDAAADAAAALALANTALRVRALCRFYRNDTNNGAGFALSEQVNVTSVVNVTSLGLVRVTFTAALPDVYYFPILLAEDGVLPTLSSRTTGYCELNFPNSYKRYLLLFL